MVRCIASFRPMPHSREQPSRKSRSIITPKVRANRNPLLSLSVLFSGFGMQCIMMGLLAELLMRTYHESQGKPTYVVSNILSLNATRVEGNEAVTEQMVALR